MVSCVRLSVRLLELCRRLAGNGKAFRRVGPKCAASFAGGCFGEIAATTNTGRGLRFPVRREVNCDWPHPHREVIVFWAAA